MKDLGVVLDVRTWQKKRKRDPTDITKLLSICYNAVLLFACNISYLTFAPAEFVCALSALLVGSIQQNAVDSAMSKQLALLCITLLLVLLLSLLSVVIT